MANNKITITFEIEGRDRDEKDEALGFLEAICKEASARMFTVYFARSVRYDVSESDGS